MCSCEKKKNITRSGAYGSWQGGQQKDIQPRENKEQTTKIFPQSVLFYLQFKKVGIPNVPFTVHKEQKKNMLL